MSVASRRLQAWVGLAAIFASGSAFAGTFYNSEAAFTPNIAPNPYIENFNNFTFGTPLNGSQTSWPAPGGNGYGWTAAAVGGLWSNQGALSTNQAFDPIIITFTGAPVTALGGNFTNTDINGNIIPGTVTIALSDGSTQSLTNPTSTSFLGYTADVPITSVTVSTPTGATNGWVQIDHFYSASVVPEPTALAAALGGAGMLLARRRRA